MTISTIYRIDPESALAEELAGAVAAHLQRDAEFAYDTDGDVAGITYFDRGAGRWYAADLDDCRAYVETVRDTAGVDSYSIWCGNTDQTGESASRAECLAAMGWTA